VVLGPVLLAVVGIQKLAEKEGVGVLRDLERRQRPGFNLAPRG
jgi:hypothetical protein